MKSIGFFSEIVSWNWDFLDESKDLALWERLIVPLFQNLGMCILWKFPMNKYSLVNKPYDGLTINEKYIKQL